MSTPANERAGIPLGHRLVQLGAELRLWRPFWSTFAFRERVLPWEPELPDLASRLRAMDAERIHILSADSVALDAFLCDWFPVDHWRALEAVDPAPQGTLRAWPRCFERDVPGRKWDQVTAFCSAVGRGPEGKVVDWCAGKAHLGRALAFQWEHADVLALERNPALARAAADLALRDGLTLRAETCDVMGSGVRDQLTGAAHAVALHACGALHRRLLEMSVASGVSAVSCAPCCFHLGPGGELPRSMAARPADPGLAPADLRTAVQEEVTAGGHARRRRERLQVWQLGFDALLREGAGRSVYAAAPGAPAEVLAGDFAGYCQHAAVLKGSVLPTMVDYTRWERRGEVRFREVAALDLVRRRFRRLIELWLVADLGAWLEEAGYRVRLQTFCTASLSPRNLLLQARLEV